MRWLRAAFRGRAASRALLPSGVSDALRGRAGSAPFLKLEGVDEAETC